MRYLIYRIEDWIREVKFGFQRMFRGYDDTAYWGLDTYLAEMLVPIMRWYRDNDRHMMYKKIGKTERGTTYYTKKEQREIYNKIIFSFNSVDRGNKYMKVETVGDIKRVEEGLHLFAKHFRGFWT